MRTALFSFVVATTASVVKGESVRGYAKLAGSDTGNAPAAQDAYLAWPTQSYYSNRWDISYSHVTYHVTAPIFPPSLAGADYPLSIAVQCTGCGTGVLQPCMTMSSSTGNLYCGAQGLHICDNSQHVCTDALPSGTTLANQYDVTVTNNNVYKSLTAAFAISMDCPNGSLVNSTVCQPVIKGKYPTACVFTGGNAFNGQDAFGMNGCSCTKLTAQGCSTCWDGSVPKSCVNDRGVQYCGSSCPPPPAAEE